MPKVPSLRRSLSGYNDRAAALVGHVRALSTESLRPGPATPPPPYQEPIASLTSVLSEIDFQETPPTSPHSLPADASIFVNDERAGIKWEFARQDFSRQLYIDAVSYLLRGLPRNLSVEETLRLQAAMPSEMMPLWQSADRTIVQGQSHDDRVTQQEEDPTILHRTVAMVVLQIFLLLSFLWPYVETTCRGAYQYEREHHISEKLLNQSWTTANAVSKNTMTAAKTVCSWNDGQVGTALEDAVFWWVHSITGGLRDGVKDGMEVFGVRSPDHRDKRPARA
ncbi:hypothetical protein E4T44_10565 [Aureobasidium sp. EXF-8845]|nr:hypothetical protein E4T44_10565 [Aureobasidium sp. EXF-8845]KAI4823050.1 hypothetical protein E4T45_10464 [Aureobasidium sp. EXF-8846]